MKKQIVALMLALVFVVALFAGCGNKTAETAETPAVETEEKTAVVEQEETAEVETTETEEPEEVAEASEETAETEESEYGYWPLPLCEDVETITFFSIMNGQVLQAMESLADCSSIKEAERLTNVHMEGVTYSGQQAGEKFPLMVAAEEYCDLMAGFSRYYSGGLDAAINDGILLDLTEIAEKYAPDYWEVIHEKTRYIQDGTTNEGRMGNWIQLNDPWPGMEGYGIRQDYLDAVGMEVPTTYDELHEVLVAFKSQLGVESPFYLNSCGIGRKNATCAAFGIALEFNSTASTNFYYVEDGVVKTGYQQYDALKSYLSLMHDWYNEGLVPADFTTDKNIITIDMGNMFDRYCNGDIAIAWLDPSLMTSLYDVIDVENFGLSVMNDPMLNEGDINHIIDTGDVVGLSYGLWADSPNVELVCKYMNFWYSEGGSTLGSYGVEGEAWTWVDGERQFTDLIINNPDGYSFTIVSSLYMLDEFAYRKDTSRDLLVYKPGVAEKCAHWNDNRDAAYTYPSFATLTADESEEYNLYATDLMTYISENLPQFINGDLSIEDDFDAFYEQVDAMGIGEMVALRQTAYDRYVARG